MRRVDFLGVKHRPLIIALLLPLLCADCGGRTIVVMHNPKTGETAQRQSDHPCSLVAMAAVDDSAKPYEKLGVGTRQVERWLQSNWTSRWILAVLITRSSAFLISWWAQQVSNLRPAD
jgi:hypothetical protein